jgi:threonylcarbamoyladenosine tRNA methylthiotransferase MtaB
MANEHTYRVTTLGCRVNRADSLMIEKHLAARGYSRALPGDTPDIWVVNTCAVTAEGMRKSRKAVRKIAASPASVIVTGCGVDFEPEAFTLEGVSSVVRNKDKGVLVDAACTTVGVDCGVDLSPEELVRVPVKVQEGCARYCTYCVVPHLRPGPYCKSIRDVELEARDLEERGVGEIILCGIDLGTYSDPESGAGLAELVDAVSRAAPSMWLRLSSIELTDVDDALIERMRDGSLCRHLHVPLQSGDLDVLRAMGRNYTPSFFEERVGRIGDIVPGVSVTSDIMVGFPGETDEAFENSLGVVRRLEFSRLHIFKYSPRRGTKAYALGDPVPPEVKKRRAQAMRDAAARSAAAFHDRLVGRIIPVLVEGAMDSEPGRLFGRAESFAGAIFDGGSDLIARRVGLMVEEGGLEGIRGTIVPPGAEGE